MRVMQGNPKTNPIHKTDNKEKDGQNARERAPKETFDV